MTKLISIIPFTENGSYTYHFTSVAPSLKLGFLWIASLPIVGFATVVADAHTETRRVTLSYWLLSWHQCVGAQPGLVTQPSCVGLQGALCHLSHLGAHSSHACGAVPGNGILGQLQPARAWLPGLSSCSSSLGVHTRPGGCCQGRPWSRRCWPSHAWTK